MSISYSARLSGTFRISRITVYRFMGSFNVTIYIVVNNKVPLHLSYLYSTYQQHYDYTTVVSVIFLNVS